MRKKKMRKKKNNIDIANNLLNYTAAIIAGLALGFILGIFYYTIN